MIIDNMETAELIKKYLEDGRLMQIATVNGGQPWICSVYYVVDESQNLYWLSLPSRRHSQDIAKDNRVAIAVAIKRDQPVIGIQVEGTAATVTDHEIIKRVMQLYTKRYNSGQDFYDNFVSGKNQHILYKFT